MDQGKIDRSFFQREVYPRLGADRDDVLLGPAHGVDFGAVEVGDRAVAVATDPVWLLEDLPTERAAWLAVQFLLADAAMSGLPPTHLTVGLNLPPSMPESAFSEFWGVLDREARAHGASVVTGHTAAYEGCAYPAIGAGTTLAVGDPDRLVRPDGAEPGDRLLVTKGPAVEATGLLAELFGDLLDLPAATVAAARERFPEISPVEDALTAARAGPVTAMHDATERGLANALTELAAASGVALAVDRAAVPVAPGVEAVCGAFDVDPWTASSEGAVLITVSADGADAVLDALADAGIRAAAVGEVRAGEGVTVDGESVSVPDEDPLWAAYQRGRELRATREE
ncbi:MAG: AIR synthase family protein [Halobacteriaceae archaeon]